jgi:thioesterase domain-containing protein
LDRNLREVAIGAVGELYVGGVSVGRGYLGRQALTAERFLPDAFTPRSDRRSAGARLYRTGDLARCLAHGEIEFLGRIDHQVKIRGFRIELGEIERVLGDLTAVRDTVVLALKDGLGGQRLVAYVVAEAGRDLDVKTLRKELLSRLPVYMVPLVFVILEELPLTPNGKVDRKALPQPDSEWLGSEIDYVAPRTHLEKQLVEIWQELLGLDRVGIYDDFFKIGGHSLLATQFVSRVRRQIGTDLPLGLLFGSPTIAALVAHLKTSTTRATTPFLVSLRSTGHRPPLVLAHAVGGDVVPYQGLAQALSEEQPLYGLRARGLEPGETPLDNLREMATQYVESIRELDTSGPYSLGGWSMGGLIAFEMAQQLVAMGAEVARLTLIDSHIPDPEAEALENDEFLFWSLFAQELGFNAGALGMVEKDLEKLAGQSLTERLTALLKAIRATGLLPTNFGLPEAQARFNVFSACVRANERYVAQPLTDVPTLLIEAQDRVDGGGAKLLPKWQPLIHGASLQVESLPGNHHSILIGAAAVPLAEVLEHFIQAQAPSKPLAVTVR